MRSSLFIVLASILLFTSCNEVKDVINETTISGTISNHKDKVLKINDFLGKSEWRQVIPISDNAFEVKIELEKPAIKMLQYASLRKDVFLRPGASLEVHFDAEDIENSIEYSGDLTLENEILDTVSSIVDNIDYMFVYGQDLVVAVEYLDSIESASKALLQKLTPDKMSNSDFVDYADASIKYRLAGLKIMLGERKKVRPENYYAFLDDLSFTDPDLLDIPDYRMFLYFYMDRESNLRLQKLDSLQQKEPDAAFMASLQAIEDLQNDEIKAYSLFNAMIMKLEDSGIKDFDKHYQYFKEHNTDQHYNEQLEIAYAKKNAIAPGQKAPAFTLKDINGEEKSLNDFKGQYVLLDFWNTKCPRCSRELPHFMELQSDYKNENIAFVTISNDPDTSDWKTYVKENKNVGTSLWANNTWDAEVLKAYQVSGTPTYVLIDKEGKIIDPVAPKPSSPKLRDAINEMLAIE